MAGTLSALEVWFRARQGSDEAGQGLAEYGLILALIAVVAITALTGLGTAIVNTLTQITSSL